MSFNFSRDISLMDIVAIVIGLGGASWAIFGIPTQLDAKIAQNANGVKNNAAIIQRVEKNSDRKDEEIVEKLDEIKTEQIREHEERREDTRELNRKLDRIIEKGMQ